MLSSNSYTADGTTKNFEVGFEFISEADIRVIVNGVLKTRGTDYSVQNPTAGNGSKATIAFGTAPTNTHAIKFYRNTPVTVPTKNPTISHLMERVALYRMQEREESSRRVLKGYINATDLAAGTAKSFVAQCDGYIELLRTVVVDAAVGTGGAVTVEIDGVAVTGLTVTVGNSAAIGSVLEDTPTTAQSSTTKVKRGQTITVTPAAAFATSGALLVEVELQPADI